MEGWVKLHRKILKWEWFQDDNTFRVFLHLLLTANYKNTKWKGIEIKRGQVLTGRSSLAVTIGISEQSVRTCLNRLKLTSEITIKSTNKYSIVTINKYEDYQIIDSNINQQNNQQPNKPSTNNQPTTNHIQEDKKEKNKEKEEEKEIFSIIINPEKEKEIVDFNAKLLAEEEE
jgi:biotin operon repressor